MSNYFDAHDKYRVSCRQSRHHLVGQSALYIVENYSVTYAEWSSAQNRLFSAIYDELEDLRNVF